MPNVIEVIEPVEGRTEVIETPTRSTEVIQVATRVEVAGVNTWGLIGGNLADQADLKLILDTQSAATDDIVALLSQEDPFPQYAAQTDLEDAIASIPEVPVQSVHGRTGNVTAQTGDYTSDQITEGVANLYYTTARFDARLAAKTTANLAEGSNLYFTNARARGSIAAPSGPLAYDSTTGTFSIPAASSAQDGYFSAVNWNKLSGIQSGATANSSDVQLRDRSTHTGTQPLNTIEGLEIALESKLNSPLSASDIPNLPASKITSGTLADSVIPGSIARDSEVVAGLETKADLDDPRFVDARPPIGAAGGVLAGSYPNPSFAVDMATQAELNAVIDSIPTVPVQSVHGRTGDVAAQTGDYTAAQVGAIASIEKGAAGGVTPLGSDSKIPTTYLPALAITDTFVVSSQAAMLALSAETGDVAVRSDLNKSFILQGSSPSILANWQELLTPTDAVLSVNGFTGSVVLTTSTLAEGANLYYTDTRFDARLSTKTTSNLVEGTNLYYTDARARASVSGTAPLSYNSTTGVFSIQAASGSQNGYLSSTDWNTFSNKQAALGYTPLNPANNLSEVTASTARTNLGLGAAATLSNTTATWNANQLQGRAIASTAPTDLQALRWNGTTSQWEPQTSTVLSANITDSTTTGRSLLTTASASAARTTLGTVAGPGTSTTGAIAKYSNTTGDLANSGVAIDSSNNLTTTGAITSAGITTTGAAAIKADTTLDGTLFAAGNGLLVYGVETNANTSNSISNLVAKPGGSNSAIGARYVPSGSPVNFGYVFQFQNHDSVNTQALLFIGYKAGGKHILAADTRGSGSAYPLVFRCGAGTWDTLSDAATLKTTGDFLFANKVGVGGVTSPGAALQISGGIVASSTTTTATDPGAGNCNLDGALTLAKSTTPFNLASTTNGVLSVYPGNGSSSTLAALGFRNGANTFLGQISFSSAGNFLVSGPIQNGTSGAPLVLLTRGDTIQAKANAASDIPLTLKLASGQSASALAVSASDSSIPFSIAPDGSTKIGVNSTAIRFVGSAIATLDFPSIAAGSYSDLTITVTGASVGDSVSIGLPATPQTGIVFGVFVSATNTITIRANNYTAGAIDPPSASYRVSVIGF